jgi:(2S)-methylsuccinyl-CoA dehydrogenase
VRQTALPASIALAQEAASAAEAILVDAISAVRGRVGAETQTKGILDREQRVIHGLAWLATYAQSLRQLHAWAKRVHAGERFGQLEDLILLIGTGEYLAQMVGGIPISQTEIVRPADFGLSAVSLGLRMAGRLEGLFSGNEVRRAQLVSLVAADRQITAGECGLIDMLDSVRDEIRKFADSEIVPRAQTWHKSNALIPLEIIGQLAELGVFRITAPEPWGGMGLGKEASCIIAEELSRGYLAIGSLATRSEIAVELILNSGTEEQKRRWLRRIASGEVLPAAVFTEPDSGSDLASVKTRAVRYGRSYRINGSKTWITHAGRADLMTILVRTDRKVQSHRGLSILLAEKPRGSGEVPFPAEGISGSEIEVIGYRGMREYEIAFDGYEVASENLLGGVEGLGFKQLMQTFESSRIQTAARAIGVAQAAMEQALGYALTRRQFGRSIIGFPRIADKIAMMAVEIMIARQLTYFAAREKDSGRRCDLESGMAKLLAARVAWAAADGAVQVHGGNGIAVDFPVSRILCDARVLSIFEGSAEIQAEIIARRILDHTM